MQTAAGITRTVAARSGRKPIVSGPDPAAGIDIATLGGTDTATTVVIEIDMEIMNRAGTAQTGSGGAASVAAAAVATAPGMVAVPRHATCLRQPLRCRISPSSLGATEDVSVASWTLAALWSCRASAPSMRALYIWPICPSSGARRPARPVSSAWQLPCACQTILIALQALCSSAAMSKVHGPINALESGLLMLAKTSYANSLCLAMR